MEVVQVEVGGGSGYSGNSSSGERRGPGAGGNSIPVLAESNLQKKIPAGRLKGGGGDKREITV